MNSNVNSSLELIGEIAAVFGLSTPVRRLSEAAYWEHPYLFLSCPEEFFESYLGEALANAVLRVGELDLDTVCREIEFFLRPDSIASHMEYHSSRWANMRFRKAAVIWHWLKFMEQSNSGCWEEGELAVSRDYWRALAGED